MADQKRWFKVWTSIIANGRFAEMSLEDIGRWTLVGAATALDGDDGILDVPGTGKELCRLLRVDDLDAAKDALLRIASVSFEEGKNRNGEFTVTWNNWQKYQLDSTSRERQKKFRDKKRNDLRGEERRREEIRGEEKRNRRAVCDLAFENFWKSYPRKVGKPVAFKAWQRLPALLKGRPDEIMAALEKHKQQDQWQKDGGRFIPHAATWINQRRWEDEIDESEGEETLEEARARHNRLMEIANGKFRRG